MKLKKFDALLKKRFSKEVIERIEQQAKLEKLAYEQLQNDIAEAVDHYMKKENIGFNELVRRLDVSPTHLVNIQNGTANLTISSIARLAAVIGGVSHIVFKTSGR